MLLCEGDTGSDADSRQRITDMLVVMRSYMSPDMLCWTTPVIDRGHEKGYSGGKSFAHMLLGSKNKTPLLHPSVNNNLYYITFIHHDAPLMDTA